MQVSLTGKDTLMIDTQIINDLVDGDAVNIEFTEDLATVKRGKDGNTIYAINENGAKSLMTVRVGIGSDADKYLNSRLAELRADSSLFRLMVASFAKRVGDGQGNMSTVVYQASGGIFKKIPGAIASAEGNTDQSVAVWVIEFGNAPRSVQ